MILTATGPSEEQSRRASGIRATVWLSFRSERGRGPVLAIQIALRVLQALVLLAVWEMVPDVSRSGMSHHQLQTYTIVSCVLYEVLNARTKLGAWIWDGTITSSLAQPMPLGRQLVCRVIGRWLAIVLPSAVVIGLVAWTSHIAVVPASPLAGVLFVASLGMAIVIGVTFDVALNLLVVLAELPLWIIDSLRQAITALLSGALLPLAVMPDAVESVLMLLPFASMASAPLTLFVGTADSAAETLALQAFWALAGLVFAALLLRKAYERMQVHGG